MQRLPNACPALRPDLTACSRRYGSRRPLRPSPWPTARPTAPTYPARLRRRRPRRPNASRHSVADPVLSAVAEGLDTPLGHCGAAGRCGLSGDRTGRHAPPHQPRRNHLRAARGRAGRAGRAPGRASGYRAGPGFCREPGAVSDLLAARGPSKPVRHGGGFGRDLAGSDGADGGHPDLHTAPALTRAGPLRQPGGSPARRDNRDHHGRPGPHGSNWPKTPAPHMARSCG
jgi:hypothetical protein